MNLSQYSNFPVSDLFGIFDQSLFSHVFLTLPEKRLIKSAKKSQKTSKIGILR